MGVVATRFSCLTVFHGRALEIADRERFVVGARWAATSYKWSDNPYTWPQKWVTGVITPISGVINLIIISRGPPCGWFRNPAVASQW